MSQIALPLDPPPSSADDGYLVTQCNADVQVQLDNYQLWPHQTAILIGPRRSGKTAMARQFEAASGGYVLDPANHARDDKLFHLWNRAKNEGRALLLVSSQPVSQWGVTLADLQSRLASSMLIEIGAPDDAMVTGLLQKYFATRGTAISEDALGYLTKRIERSYNNIETLARQMDNMAMTRKKAVTLNIAREALESSVDYQDRD